MNTSYLFLQRHFGNTSLVGAEIGVLSGESSEKTLEIMNMEKLYLIDIWAPYEEKGIIYDYTNEYEKVVEKFKDNKKVIIKKQTSLDASKDFKDESLDFVYIDACHDYEKVKEDLNIWFKKVKKGGMLCGDDCDIWWVDVMRAIKEFARENKLEVFQMLTNKQNANGDVVSFIPSDWIIIKPEKTIYTDMRDAMFEELYKNALKDKDVILLLGDQNAGTFKKFRENIPEQIINVGPSEQNLIGIAAGLAICGKKVFVHGISPFITLRCFEQISLDLGLRNLPVTIIGIGAGFSYSHEGPTHHSIQDFGIFKTIPNMSIYNVADTICLAELSNILYNSPQLSYIKFDHQSLPLIYDKIEHDFTKGLAKLKEGKDTMIIATGNMVHKALEITKDTDIGVIDLYRIAPLNKKLLLNYLEGIKNVITIEEHLECGGIGSSVADFICDNNLSIKFKRFGLKNYIQEYGKRDYIAKLNGLDIDTLKNGIKS